jgi:hypothetical protein
MESIVVERRKQENIRVRRPSPVILSFFLSFFLSPHVPPY